MWDVPLIFLMHVKQQVMYTSSEAVNLSTSQRPDGRFQLAFLEGKGVIFRPHNSTQIVNVYHSMEGTTQHPSVWFQRGTKPSARITGREVRVPPGLGAWCEVADGCWRKGDCSWLEAQKRKAWMKDVALEVEYKEWWECWEIKRRNAKAVRGPGGSWPSPACLVFHNS